MKRMITRKKKKKRKKKRKRMHKSSVLCV